MHTQIHSQAHIKVNQQQKQQKKNKEYDARERCLHGDQICMQLIKRQFDCIARKQMYCNLMSIIYTWTYYILCLRFSGHFHMNILLAYFCYFWRSFGDAVLLVIYRLFLFFLGALLFYLFIAYPFSFRCDFTFNAKLSILK